MSEPSSEKKEVTPEKRASLIDSRKSSTDRPLPPRSATPSGFATDFSTSFNYFDKSFLTRPIAMSSATFSVARDTMYSTKEKIITAPDAAQPQDYGLLVDCAAVVIQCATRKHLAVQEANRRRAHRRMGKNNGIAESIDIEIPTNIATIRGASVDIREEEAAEAAEEASYGLMDEMAATVIQTKARQMSAKRRVDGMKEARKRNFEAEVNASLEQSAAITVQAAQRRHAAQKLLKEKSGEKLNTSTGSSSPAPAPPKSDEPTQSPSTFSRKRQQQARVGGQSVTGSLSHSSSLNGPNDGDGSGYGLSVLFFDSTALLLDRRATVQSLWGIRVLHAVAMEMKSKEFLPQLEASKWIQGPLRSVIPDTALTASHSPGASPPQGQRPGSGNRPSSAGRLPPLEKRPGSGDSKKLDPIESPPKKASPAKPAVTTGAKKPVAKK